MAKFIYKCPPSLKTCTGSVKQRDGVYVAVEGPCWEAHTETDAASAAWKKNVSSCSHEAEYEMDTAEEWTMGDKLLCEEGSTGTGGPGAVFTNQLYFRL